VHVLDTNVFIRYITNDDSEKAERSAALIERLASGEVQARTCEAVIAEIVYVLTSPRLAYRATRQEVRIAMRQILLLRGLHLADRALYWQALDLYVAHRIDFEDAILAAHVQRGTTDDAVVSYDTGFDVIEGVRREEP
jgi:predicted nucleic acid-binding protein